MSIEKASVSAPLFSSSTAIPIASPFVSPCGIRAYNFFIVSIFFEGEKSSLQSNSKSPVMALFPFSGVDACAFAPSAVISKTGTRSYLNCMPVSFVTSLAFASTSSISKPSMTAFAFGGTTFTFVPASILTSLFSPASSREAENSPCSCPFSIFTTGNSPSGENVIGASFSLV